MVRRVCVCFDVPRNNHTVLVAERVYGGLKSWDILVSETSQGRAAPISSKAWHAWQLFTATLPALAIYLISTSQEEQAMRAKEDVNMTDTKDDDSNAITQKLLQDINQRLTALESQVHAVLAAPSPPTPAPEKRDNSTQVQ